MNHLKKADGREQYILLIVDSFSQWCEAFKEGRWWRAVHTFNSRQFLTVHGVNHLKKADGGEQYILLIVDSFSQWCEAFKEGRWWRAVHTFNSRQFLTVV